jgi:hypothetical protein
MNFMWFDFVGSVGVAVIILIYFLLQTEKIKSDSLIYSLLNAVGSGLIVFSLLFSFNFSAFVVEILWVLISLYGIAKFILNRRKA